MAPWIGANAAMDAVVERAWGVIAAACGPSDEQCLVALGPWVANFTVFWLLAGPLTIFSLYPSLSPIERYKVQKGKYEEKAKILEIVAVGLRNQGLALCVTLGSFWLDRDLFGSTKPELLPGAVDLALQIVLCAVLYDCFFFLCHSAMHTKLMYNRFHKFHHLSKISIAPTALYFHPLDFMITVNSLALPAIIVGRHAITMYAWLIVSTVESVLAHCGYSFPFWFDAEHHDLHHSHSTYHNLKYRYVNMGSFFLLPDRLFGTIMYEPLASKKIISMAPASLSSRRMSLHHDTDAVSMKGNVSKKYFK